MPKMITKFAKRFLTGSVLLGAVVLAPRDGCDRLGTRDVTRTLAGFGDTEDLVGYGGPDAVEYGGQDALTYGGPDAVPVFKPAEF
jgi:hypothetical protein